MILLDTSAWIYFFKNGWPNTLDLDDVLLCAPIIQEILQGINDEASYINIRNNLINFTILSDPIQFNLYIKAADLYRLGRSKGFTIRSSIDCLISVIAIENNVPVMHYDRDFDNIEKFTSLKIIRLEK